MITGRHDYPRWAKWVKKQKAGDLRQSVSGLLNFLGGSVKPKLNDGVLMNYPDYF